MKEDITRIITMLEEGKINKEEAEELIHALKTEPSEDESIKTSRSYTGKVFKVRIKSRRNDNVNVNFPLKLIQMALKMGHGIASSIPQMKAYMDDIDMDLIMQSVDKGVEGKIIDMETDEGDLIAIYIE